jgi:hypothetical protein
MLVYLVSKISSTDAKVFTNEQLAKEYLEQSNKRTTAMFKAVIYPIELITDEFMELTLQQPKPSKEFT